MSFLSDIHAYWQANASLNLALSSDKVYTGIVPEGTAYPYAVIVPIASVPTWTTGAPYLEEFAFQISVFSRTAAEAETIAQAVMNQFDWKTIAASTVYCERTNYMVIAEEKFVYQAMIEYRLSAQKSHG